VSANFTYAGVLSYPMDQGISPCEIPINFAGTFEHEAKGTLKLVGSGTQSVDFGSLISDGAKVIQIEYDADVSPASQPVYLQFNGAGAPGQVELTSGSFFSYGNRAPSAGILSMDIVHAADAVLRVRILG
jgi:hypothetical protein